MFVKWETCLFMVYTIAQYIYLGCCLPQVCPSFRLAMSGKLTAGGTKKGSPIDRIEGGDSLCVPV